MLKDGVKHHNPSTNLYSQNSQYKTDSDYYNENNKLTVYTTYTRCKDRLRKQQDRRLSIIQVLPSYEVNIESCQPKGGCLNNLLRIDKLMLNSYEGICFAKDNKIIYNYETGLEKNGFSTHFRLSWVVDRATTCCKPADNLLFSLTLYMFRLFTG